MLHDPREENIKKKRPYSQLLALGTTLIHSDQKSPFHRRNWENAHPKQFFLRFVPILARWVIILDVIRGEGKNFRMHTFLVDMPFPSGVKEKSASYSNCLGLILYKPYPKIIIVEHNKVRHILDIAWVVSSVEFPTPPP